MKYSKIILKSFGLGNKKIGPMEKVENYLWDSMTKINLISNINDKFSKTIDHTKLEKIVYFKDIDALIEKTIKK
jgi:acyl carrier protein